MNNKDIYINKHFFFKKKLIIIILIDNIVNVRELFWFILIMTMHQVITINNHYLFKSNSGLLKSIIHIGIIYMNHNNIKYKKINISLIYLIKSEEVKIIKGMETSIEKTNNEGFTTIFYVIKSGDGKFFWYNLK